MRRNFSKNRTNVVIWHPLGRKYFWPLVSGNFPYTVKFKNYIILRKLLGRHPSIPGLKFSKPIFLSGINVFCMPPFDINIIFVWIGKVINPSSKFILHTSYPDHVDGYFFKFSLLKRFWGFVVGRHFSFVITPNPLMVEHLESVYADADVEFIPHPIKDVFHNLASSERQFDVAFVGEKSIKKGFDRFCRLLISYPELNGVSAGADFGVERISKNHESFDFLPAEELAKILRMTKILLVPSRRVNGWEELFGIVIVEALACGCVVICSDHIGPKYLASKTDRVFLLPDDDMFDSRMAQLVSSLSNSWCKAEGGDFVNEFRTISVQMKWQSLFDKVSEISK